jgi:hypothetical protein
VKGERWKVKSGMIEMNERSRDGSNVAPRAHWRGRPVDKLKGAN